VETGDFCELHTKAHDNIIKTYESWKKTLGISWKEYLSKIAKNPLTGEWAKEVAEFLLNDGDKQNVA
jgi:hypothetical protein